MEDKRPAAGISTRPDLEAAAVGQRQTFKRRHGAILSEAVGQRRRQRSHHESTRKARIVIQREESLPGPSSTSNHTQLKTSAPSGDVRVVLAVARHTGRGSREPVHQRSRHRVSPPACPLLLYLYELTVTAPKVCLPSVIDPVASSLPVKAWSDTEAPL